MIKQILCLLLLPQLLVFGTLDRIQKAMEKQEYEKALELIEKGYEKEPENPGISYYHAQLLFNEAFYKNNIDSARIAIEQARDKFGRASDDLKEEVKKDGITPEKVDSLYGQIRDHVFKKTVSDLSVSKANSFLSKFPESIYEDILIYKIDSMEFLQVRLLNMKSDLVKFIANYPKSVFKAKADSILDNLRFNDLQASGSLEDYYAFHENHPFTRHKARIENFILRGSTASHKKEKYKDFIRFAATASLKKKAADVLYYLSKKEDNLAHPNQDSIQRVIALSETELYPVAQNGLFGFFDLNGQSKISHQYQGIPESYKCTLIKDDWIFVRSENEGLILTKEDKVVFRNVDDYRSISEDIGLLKHEERWFLYHKSGFTILDKSVEDAEVIGNKWIKIKSGGRWGLVSFMGLQVAEPIYDDIFKMESFWIFEKNNLLAVYTENLILEEIEERGVSLEFKFDDIELAEKNALIGFRGERECLLDSTLSFLIPWGNYEIYPEASGWYLKSDKGYQLYNESETDLMDRHYSYLESNDGWLALKTETDWMLIPRRNGLLPSRSYDSIKLVNTYAAVLIEETQKKLIFSSGEEIPFTNERIQTFPNRDGFISLSSDVATTILDKNGEEVVSGKFENTLFLNDSLIRVQTRGKQGLMHINGDWILNPLFDTIDEKDGLVLTLIDGKIGCYDPQINELISTDYEARIERIHGYYLAKQDGKFGVINHVKEELISFNYDNIQFWNDTSYLAEKEGKFFIIDLNEEHLYSNLESVKILTENDDHSLFRFVKDGKYGLLSNQFGKLLEPEFTDIFNIGSTEEPLIFADQHLDKAGFHVVSYVNETGELILSKAYTREEFDKILCDD